MSGFDANWLHQREPFDLAARSGTLAAQFCAAVASSTNGPLRIIDLAAGAGANFRALAPLLHGDQDWLLVDHDPVLLDAQQVQIARWATDQGWSCHALQGGLSVDTGSARWRVRGHLLDLAQSLEQLELAGFDGVTTTAFLDLVSAAWLDRLGTLLAHARRPLLATLTVDGRREWLPHLPTDKFIHDAFLRHQSGDKGFGASLGSAAAAYLADRLTAHGHLVKTACSDWHIGADQRDMQLKMLEETLAVACATEPAASPLFAEWADERTAQIERRQLLLTVGHLDLLALPPA